MNEVALLTGGFDPHYAWGLARTLCAKGVHLDVVGSAALDTPEMRGTENLRFLDLYWDPRQKAGSVGRILRVLAFYLRLVRYVATTKAGVVHILWNNKIQIIDRTFLMVCYKVLGKKIVFTAHNVNAGQRDASDSLLNRLTLKVQYQLSDHIFVHTAKMKQQLLDEFGVRDQAVTVINHPVNVALSQTDLTCDQARKQLGIGPNEKVILFFGAIRPYKGLEYLVSACEQFARKHSDYRLVVAGEPKKGNEDYLETIQRMIAEKLDPACVIQDIRYVADEEVEVYCKAADVLVLPYKEIFQSGVLFVGYAFGLPAIAADVGSFREYIVEGKTGFLYSADDANGLADTLEEYFTSDLYRELSARRADISDYAHTEYSWDKVGDTTRSVYAGL